jgi:hypothetical protein
MFKISPIQMELCEINKRMAIDATSTQEALFCITCKQNRVRQIFGCSILQKTAISNKGWISKNG